MELVKVIVFLALVASGSCWHSGMIGGQKVESIEQFPFHVTITKELPNGEEYLCSGTIIEKGWLLSTLRCVSDGVKFVISFRELDHKKTEGAFSIVVDKTAVHTHPNGTIDLAVIKLPVTLNLGVDVQFVRMLLEDQELENKYTVMPGFNENFERLHFAELKIIPKDECKKVYGVLYDEETEVCTRGWESKPDVPCEHNEGAGLFIDWPRNTKLVGTFHTPLNCESEAPAIFTHVHKHIDWITATVNTAIKSG